MRKLALSLCLLALGCGGSLPDPKIVSVTPAEATASSVVQLKVQLDAVLPSSANYGNGSAESDPRVTVFVGETNIGTALVDPKNLASLLVPTVLAPGAYDVRVVFGDGRAAVAPGSFTVTPGQWPASYTIDAIGTPTSDTPFPITIRAVGGTAATFTGNVTITVNKGSVTPGVSGAFVNGVVTQNVTISGKGAGFVITVQDASGATGVSNAFRVN